VDNDGLHRTVNETAPSPAEEDWPLAQRIVHGDRLAFELLMRRNNKRLYRLACVTLRDPAEAQDALQEVYLHAYRSMEQFRGEAALSTWLTRLTLNECLGRLRRDARRQNVIPIVRTNTDTAVEALPAPDSYRPDSSLDVAQMRELIERKLQELPEHFRIVFVLRSVEELSVEETARCLEIPEETVRSRHFRAKGLLREALARQIDLAERDLYQFGGEHCDRLVVAVLARLAAQGPR